MKKIFFCLVILLLVPGCVDLADLNSSNGQLAEDADVFDPTKAEFDKKMECSTLMPAIRDYVSNDLTYEDGNISSIGSLTEVFYSSIQNSCLFIATQIISLPNHYMQNYILQDGLSNEVIIVEVGCNYIEDPCKQTIDEAKNTFDIKVSLYR